MKPGDKIDNDCDGNVDEEMSNGVDDDGDGKVDEDLGLQPTGYKYIFVSQLQNLNTVLAFASYLTSLVF